jgi:hypothetical protein
MTKGNGMSIDVVRSATLGELTGDDIAAMRAADGLSFHHLRPGDRDGHHVICAYLRNYGDQRIYTAREQRLFPQPHSESERVRSIAVESRAAGYGYGSDATTAWTTEYGDATDARAFASVSTMRATIRTMLDLLRIGDVITLQWTADNNTENIRQVGFHADYLTLSARRASGRVLTFHVDSSTGPDNTARMIRRHG